MAKGKGETVKVEMLVQISGTRDGEFWPEPGETIDVPAAEADTLVAAGSAKVARERKSSSKAGAEPEREKAVETPPENATEQ